MTKYTRRIDTQREDSELTRALRNGKPQRLPARRVSSGAIHENTRRRCAAVNTADLDHLVVFLRPPDALFGRTRHPVQLVEPTLEGPPNKSIGVVVHPLLQLFPLREIIRTEVVLALVVPWRLVPLRKKIPKVVAPFQRGSVLPLAVIEVIGEGRVFIRILRYYGALALRKSCVRGL